MRVVAVILGVLGCAMLSAVGQGDVWVGELRLQLAEPPVAEGQRPVGLPWGLDPVVVMRQLEDGSVRSRFVLGHLGAGRNELEEGVAVVLADGLTAFLKTGENQKLADGMVEIENVPPVEAPPIPGLGDAVDRVMEVEAKGTVTVGFGSRVSVVLTQDEVLRMESSMKFWLKRAKAFRGADIGMRRDAITKLQGRVVQDWRLSFELGSVDLGEFGNHRVWVEAHGTPRYSMRFEPMDPVWPALARSMNQWTFEALGRVPDELAQGKTVRWEQGGRMLRAFPENKAIYFRPEAKKGEDVWISLETAQEAWKMLEKRDRLTAWLEKEVEPGVAALLERGE